MPLESPARLSGDDVGTEAVPPGSRCGSATAGCTPRERGERTRVHASRERRVHRDLPQVRHDVDDAAVPPDLRAPPGADAGVGHHDAGRAGRPRSQLVFPDAVRGSRRLSRGHPRQGLRPEPGRRAVLDWPGGVREDALRPRLFKSTSPAARGGKYVCVFRDPADVFFLSRFYPRTWAGARCHSMEAFCDAIFGARRTRGTSGRTSWAGSTAARRRKAKSAS